MYLEWNRLFCKFFGGVNGGNDGEPAQARSQKTREGRRLESGE